MEKKRILVVEDEFSINDTLKFALSKENFEVQGAYDGETALKYMDEFKPQLVLLDVMLPDISGFELCKSMSKKSYVVMLTARDDVIDLLSFLYRNRGVVFTREQLLNEVWGYDYFGDTRTVDVQIISK